MEPVAPLAQPPGPVAGPAQPASPTPLPTPEPATAPAQPPIPVAVPAQPGAATEPLKPADSVKIDFKDAKLDDVLTYLSSAALTSASNPSFASLRGFLRTALPLVALRGTLTSTLSTAPLSHVISIVKA